MKLRDAVKDAQQRLAEAGVPDAQFDGRAIAAHVLDVKLSKLAIHQGRLLTGDELTALDTLVSRRAGREPLQYLLGVTEFYGREFLCDPRALIPRPDTESLIDSALEFIKHLIIGTIAEIGTGSGVIAITLAHEIPHSRIIATDSSESALELAAENVEMHAVGRHVSLDQGSWLEPLHEGGVAAEVEMLVSNPPYVSAEEFEMLMPEIVQHEPREALVDADPDGMGGYRALVDGCRELPSLRAIIFEVGDGQATAVADLMGRQLDVHELIMRKDIGRIDRVVAAVLGSGQ